jgi:peroxiredoxin Q/BCP
MVELGDALPDVSLTVSGGERRPLRGYGGKPLILYFYPKDDTSGCTREAIDFSEILPEITARGAEILGVSRDTPERHAKFVSKHGLTVPLASDLDDSAVRAFGVWVEKSLYGRAYMGVDRSTFLFDASGVLARVWRKVRVPGHAAQVLDALRDLT